MKDLKIIFFGTPDYVIPVLETLYNNFTLTAVVTAPDKPIGRKQTLTPTPISQKAEELKTKVLKPAKLSKDFIEGNKEFLQADIYIVASYGKIIPKELLEIPKYGALNIHPSRLPLYRGASPIQNQILDGVSDSAITIIKMDEEMDHGPVVKQVDFTLLEQDNFDTLSNKMFYESSEILPQVIEEYISGKLTAKEQDHAQSTYTGHITKVNGYFEISSPPTPEYLDRMIKAYSHWPHVWTKWNEKIVKFLPNGLIQMEGKKAVKLKEFLNGYPNFPIKSL